MILRGLLVDPADGEARALDRIEAWTGRPNPPDWADFVTIAQGWSLPYSVVLPTGEGGRPYGFQLDPIEQIIENLRGLHEVSFRSRLPAEVIPIGRTGGEDDLLLLNLDPAQPGAVLAWISGRPGWAGKPQVDALHDVASSFDEFLALLLLLEQDLDDVRDDLDGGVDVDEWLRLAERVDDVTAGSISWGPAWRRPRS